MQDKQINLGRVLGYSTYELAVRSGKFTGTLEEWLDKEMNAYNLTVNYGDEIKAFLENAIAGITDTSSVDLSEVIAARNTYRTLSERLSATDEQFDIILERLNNIDPALIGSNSIRISGIDKNVELRNDGINIQWKFVGYTTWNNLISLDELTPKFTVGDVNVVDNNNDTSVSITGTRRSPVLNFNLPKGKDGVDGGDIIDATLNDKGEMIVTVKNAGSDTVTIDNNQYIMPVIRIGEVKTLEHEQDAYVTMTGSPTNFKLNFGIPKGKPTKIKEAYKDDNGHLHFIEE